MKRASSSRGFTIVELIIVIVVIAILATITIVSYNGIQGRATAIRQAAALDRIGLAIQLWSADQGRSLYGSGAGASGNGVGAFQAKNISGYTAVSIEDLLKSSGYLEGTHDAGAFNISNVLVSPCTTSSDTRWVVYAIVTPAPSRSVADQITDTGCTATYLALYTGSSYNRNFVKAY